ncbi:MAG: DUF1822 family protein [Roseofilum sp. Belize BBD 4]|uniref:DUF1822 family protein n=2 Tax=unclassified Roseofilum TaxID=2620099 RepID=UPI001B1377BF|nr:DUF1822 family protein [Roseofilum sp. Belize BBD 4]MBP0035140.1 DUF1822 family protein [Roseofilum sp. Belize BBD 4]
MIDIINENLLILPIPERYRQWAHQFAQEQPTREKAMQVYLNTLAVLGVDDGLQMLGIETDREASDSWNSVMRYGGDFADLDVVNVGKLECRAVRKGDTVCPIPLEVWHDRIGYAIVELAEGDLQATILGFVPQVTDEILNLDQLQSLEALLDHLFDLRSASARVNPLASMIRLGEWLTGIIPPGWQAIEEFLSSDLALGFNFRSAQSPLTLRQGKSIDVGDLSLILVVEIEAAVDESMDIRLQLYPSAEQATLPPGVEFVLLGDRQNPLLTALSRSQDRGLQLQFSAEPQEIVSIQVNYGDRTWTQTVQI